MRPHTFPIRAAIRRQHDFSAPTFSDFSLARALAARLNTSRDLQNFPELAVKSGRLAAAALLDEIFAHLIALYVEEIESEALQEAPGFLDENLGLLEVQTLFETLEIEFKAPVSMESRPEKTEFLWRLQLANLNPALANFSEVFDDFALQNTIYPQFAPTLELYFGTLPTFGPHDESLYDVLLAPIRAHPDSVEDQLRFVLKNYQKLIEKFAPRILTHLDLIREEEKPFFGGPGPAQVPDYRKIGAGGSVGLNEYEGFSPDRDWMPEVVLIAKQTYVWLDQLSKKYGHHIHRFDMVPDEELDEMAARGLTGLWMIGLWQRSKASQKIKRINGNPDAIASAYSLYSYEISEELGGVAALENLKSRAAKRGIRLASDMVPNHMAIDSAWLFEHPDWFLHLPHQPFPNGNFDGTDLSDNPDWGVFLEQGYYNQSDASVVFRLLNRETGQERFVYHGNDGTAIPWNDTAQLDYLKIEVRDAVMQTILAVAHQFPIIRFDAAMTLAKRHIHRLWFPSPGEGGDIPSRAGRGVSPDEFEALMPNEFWREVVDRVAVEAPDTLLLAEAFWMMEGYFVRSLGMHRVYNSAFMVMLRDEDNQNYRLLIKNTLEFDPEILGRFVNFLNNPDEKTAAEQFGKGDKYFGVCTLMATMPGLPMFGHGQWDGFEEKYGMEYPRAYWNEAPDAPFIAHHQKVITPLLKKRALFAGSENFRLYDFWNAGSVNEDVFAFSNSKNDERALVVFNNSQSPASGWIHTSCGFLQKNADGNSQLAQTTLGAAFGVEKGAKNWVVFRDNTFDLEFLRRADELRDGGLYVELAPYGYQTFLNWREVRDEHGWYEKIAEKIGGRGVPSVARAIQEMLVAPLLEPFSLVCDADLWTDLLGERAGAMDELETRLQRFADSVAQFSGVPNDKKSFAQAVGGRVAEAVSIADARNFSPDSVQNEADLIQNEGNSLEKGIHSVQSGVDEEIFFDERAIWLGYAILAEVGRLAQSENPRAQSVIWVREWLLSEAVEKTWAHMGLDAPGEAIVKVKLALLAGSLADEKPLALLNALLAEDDAQWLLGINNFEGVLWFNGDGATQLLDFLAQAQAFENAHWPLETLRDAMENSGFRVVKWMELARGEQSDSSPSALPVTS